MADKRIARCQAYRNSQWIWIPFFAMEAWTHRHRDIWLMRVTVAMLAMVSVAWLYSWWMLRPRQEPSEVTGIQGQD